MVSDGVGGYHSRAELVLLRGRDQGTCVCAVCGWVPAKGQGVDGGMSEVWEIGDGGWCGG